VSGEILHARLVLSKPAPENSGNNKDERFEREPIGTPAIESRIGFVPPAYRAPFNVWRDAVSRARRRFSSGDRKVACKSIFRCPCSREPARSSRHRVCQIAEPVPPELQCCARGRALPVLRTPTNFPFRRCELVFAMSSMHSAP